MRDIMAVENIRPDVIETLNLYVKDGIPTGDFLRAVLENNLAEAVGRADSENIRALPAIVAYCYNEIPSACWGSPKKVGAWMVMKRMEREARRDAKLQ